MQLGNEGPPDDAEDHFSMPLIITIVCMASFLLLVAALYGCCHQRLSQRKDQVSIPSSSREQPCCETNSHHLQTEGESECAQPLVVDSYPHPSPLPGSCALDIEEASG